MLDQAAVAARNMLGELIEYRPVPWFSTDQYNWNVQILGVLDAQVESWIERPSGEDRTLLMGLRGSVIVYALAVNHGAELQAVRRLVEEAVPVNLSAFEKPTVTLDQHSQNAGQSAYDKFAIGGLRERCAPLDRQHIVTTMVGNTGT